MDQQSQFQKKRDALTRIGFPSNVVEIIHDYLPENANRPQFEEKKDNLIWIGFPPDVAQNVINFLPSVQIEAAEPNDELFDLYLNRANVEFRYFDGLHPTEALRVLEARRRLDALRDQGIWGEPTAQVDNQEVINDPAAAQVDNQEVINEPAAAQVDNQVSEPTLVERLHRNADSTCTILARGGSVERNRFKIRNNKIR
jgi:hypothetical protein